MAFISQVITCMPHQGCSWEWRALHYKKGCLCISSRTYYYYYFIIITIIICIGKLFSPWCAWVTEHRAAAAGAWVSKGMELSVPASASCCPPSPKHHQDLLFLRDWRGTLLCVPGRNRPPLNSLGRAIVTTNHSTQRPLQARSTEWGLLSKCM